MKKLFIILSLISCTGSAFAASTSAPHFFKTGQVTKLQFLSEEGTQFAIKPAGDNLLVGYPQALIGEGQLMNGVVTKVSDSTDENLGGIKLSAVTTVVVSRYVEKDEEKFLEILGKKNPLDQSEKAQALLRIPVTQVDAQNQLVFLDFSSLGSQLEIVSHLSKANGPDQFVDFKHIDSKVTTVDFSLKTLTVDVESNYNYQVKKSESEAGESKAVKFTTRWQFRLNSANNPFFVPRKATDGVGFFMTNYESPEALITRFSVDGLSDKPVLYYVKNVPTEHRASFTSAFDDWNHKLQPILGYDFFRYEMIEKEDPRYDQIVAGDIRYNVLEWDLENKAGYGGLGPSTPSPLTGEILSAQTLIQGPKIIELYKGWFKLHEKSPLFSGTQRMALFAKLQKTLRPTEVKANTTVRLGEFLNFQVKAQDGRWADPVGLTDMDFLETPPGFSYEQYMQGYFKDMVAHELGHNIGLRHNFKGSLNDKGEGTVGSVSWSVMEYLGRSHRHLDRVGPYDVMAIAYGYTGKAPELKNHYCTDENQAVYDYKNSPECSNSDATNDPISFLKSRVQRGMDLALAKGSNKASPWTASLLMPGVSPVLMTYATYIASAPFTSDAWEFYFDKPNRPKKEANVSEVLIKELNDILCADITDAVTAKESVEDQEKTKNLISDLRKQSFKTLMAVPAPWVFVTTQNFSCYSN